MAQKVTVELVDDLDGSPGEETIQFTWEGKALIIDVSKKNADKLRKAIDPFVAAARPDEAAPAPTAAPKRRGAPKGSGRQDVAAVRAWARENGHTVPDRGRLKPDIFEAYDKAH